MYSKKGPSEGVTYVWNDVAGLLGDDVTYLVCKTMLSLPLTNQKIDKILSVQAQSIENNYTEGEVYVNLVYRPLGGDERAELNFTIPYQEKVQSYHGIRPEVKQIYARPVGVYNILLETVLAIKEAKGGWRERKKADYLAGEFYAKTLFTIDNNLPNAQDVLAVQVRHTLQDQLVSDNKLRFCGLRETRILYAGSKGMEKVITTKQIEPFTESIELTRGVKDIGNIKIVNTTLNTHQINSRNIIIKGNFALEVDNLTWDEEGEREMEFKPLLTVKEADQLDEIAEDLLKDVLNVHENVETEEPVAIEEREDKEEKEVAEAKEAEVEQGEAREGAKVVIVGERAVATEKIPVETAELKKETLDAQEVEEVKEVEEIEEVEEVAEITSAKIERPAEAIGRRSRREKLSQHMRNLDQGLKNNTETQAFTISSQNKKI